MIRLLFASVIVAFATTSLSARLIKTYTYAQLFTEADLVVIGMAIESKVTKDSLSGDQNQKYYAGRNTAFKISLTLKGTPVERIELLHFNFVGEIEVDNAPHFVDFQIVTKEEQQQLHCVWSDGPPEYILFLKRMTDGRYEPVSGQTDPVFSVRKLTAPPEVESGRRSTPQSDDGLHAVKAADLGNSVKIVGRLGKPISEAVAIKGYWLFDRGTKASPYVFRVTTVAGKQLEKPVDFNQAVVSLDSVRVSDDDSILGETWTCVAIELGQFRNVTEKHLELFYGKEMKGGSWLKYGDGPFVSELLLANRSLEREMGERLTP